MAWDFSNKCVTFDNPGFFFDGSGQGAPYFRVRATQQGVYRGIFRDIGDVFDLATVCDFADASQNIIPPGASSGPFPGWMLKVPQNTPLYSWALANGGSSYSLSAVPRLVL